MKIYAYVQSETCTGTRAVLPGEEVNGKPVSRHGDYARWTHGKRKTLQRAASQPRAYERRAARAVANLLGWEARRFFGADGSIERLDFIPVDNAPGFSHRVAYNGKLTRKHFGSDFTLCQRNALDMLDIVRNEEK